LSFCSRRRRIDEWDLELMTNLADVTPFLDGVWVASPLQGQGESEGFLHGNRYVESTPHLSPLPVVLGERRNCQANYDANPVSERIN
jgi:hypothetical protein